MEELEKESPTTSRCISSDYITMLHQAMMFAAGEQGGLMCNCRYDSQGAVCCYALVPKHILYGAIVPALAVLPCCVNKSMQHGITVGEGTTAPYSMCLED